MALNYFPSKQLSVTNHTSKQDQLTNGQINQTKKIKIKILKSNKKV